MFVTLLENEHTAGSQNVLASDHTKNTMFVTLVKNLALVSQGSGSLSLWTYCGSKHTATGSPSTLLLVPLHNFYNRAKLSKNPSMTLPHDILCHFLPSNVNSFETSSVIFFPFIFFAISCRLQLFFLFFMAPNSQAKASYRQLTINTLLGILQGLFGILLAAGGTYLQCLHFREAEQASSHYYMTLSLAGVI